MTEDSGRRQEGRRCYNPQCDNTFTTTRRKGQAARRDDVLFVEGGGMDGKKVNERSTDSLICGL